MCAAPAALVPLFLGALSARGSSRAGTANSNAIMEASEWNAQSKELEAKMTLQAGSEQEERLRMAGAKLEGQQLVAMGTSGFEIGQGSFGDILDETQRAVQADAMSIRANASRQAWALRTEAEGIRKEGRASSKAVRKAGQQAGMNAFIGGVTKAFGF